MLKLWNYIKSFFSTTERHAPVPPVPKTPQRPLTTLERMKARDAACQWKKKWSGPDDFQLRSPEQWKEIGRVLHDHPRSPH